MGVGETRPHSQGCQLLTGFEAWALKTWLSEFPWPWKMWFEVNLSTQDWCLHVSALTAAAPGDSVWASRATEGGKGGHRNLQKC